MPKIDIADSTNHTAKTMTIHIDAFTACMPFAGNIYIKRSLYTPYRFRILCLLSKSIYPTKSRQK
ncbi:MAG: hypothetical protein K2K75_06505 [Muribaculaceae bacterium]|nr:hypothetical protein [Muribaculaceae bacterium]